MQSFSFFERLPDSHFTDRSTSEGKPNSLQGQGAFRVTRNLLSYSKDTLLCSGEHKNPSSDGLQENRFRPQPKTARYTLSLGRKGRGFRGGIAGAENAKSYHSDATSYHPRSKRRKLRFSTVYLPSEPTDNGRSRRTDRRSDVRANKRAFRQTDERTLRRLSRPTAQRCDQPTLGHWAVGRNIRPHIWLYGELTIKTDYAF